MTVRLRGHHLLCMLTYVGKGYTPAFSKNFDRIAGRLAEGEDILLVEGPDDICAPLVSDCGAHCPSETVRQRDRDALAAIGGFLGSVLQVGGRFCLTSTMVAHLRNGFMAASVGEGDMRRACEGCEWASLCTTIAGDGYPGVRLAMKAAHMDRTHADVREQRASGLRQIRDRSRRPDPAARNSTPVR